MILALQYAKWELQSGAKATLGAFDSVDQCKYLVGGFAHACRRIVRPLLRFGLLFCGSVVNLILEAFRHVRSKRWQERGRPTQ